MCLTRHLILTRRSSMLKFLRFFSHSPRWHTKPIFLPAPLLPIHPLLPPSPPSSPSLIFRLSHPYSWSHPLDTCTAATPLPSSKCWTPKKGPEYVFLGISFVICHGNGSKSIRLLMSNFWNFEHFHWESKRSKTTKPYKNLNFLTDLFWRLYQTYCQKSNFL